MYMLNTLRGVFTIMPPLQPIMVARLQAYHPIQHAIPAHPASQIWRVAHYVVI